jgi:hypothetical protein
MTDLFDYKPAFGKTDTSREAAIKLIPKLPKMRQTVYDGFTTPSTASEVANRVNISILSSRPRTTELQQQGLIEDTGDRRKNQWGNNEIVFRRVDQ